MSNQNQRLKTVDYLFKDIFTRLGYLQDLVKDQTKSIKKRVRSNCHIGELNPKHILKEKDIELIKELLKGDRRICDVAKMFNVCNQAIADIKHKRNWKHLEDKEK